MDEIFFRYVPVFKKTSGPKSLNVVAGTKCRSPGDLPHGKWSCSVNNLVIQGPLSEDGQLQTYPGSLSCLSTPNTYLKQTNANFDAILATPQA